ncbi:MAG TPA: adenosylmethionine--8-amino-7-oxononanoate transaminase [Syntrophorhabdus sp.]|nr:adenosylmethionine--8-amino-7-oxononanoate transaminase [Syntrophorhabdus sp.]MDI9559018.1 adenosylmethionine--8-amino-7-oxononanoate transaminase [Pseudomonadota bacterium]OPX94281.1 MAG: L-Lysine-8-amino-7-oxononanoate aminotransferase [Syntrophorhabdus sp. PtaB.Bin027]OQB73982.1 MAG: L-Lysine-8-amino-7-oxononanoate aminotransferase [Deltaproteobacteria bacterium ADurb.Bin135]NMC93153.1 adenosylmethionine--8-amino-7-oxononanoate transaminase [Syntrophorhabdus sp.]
MYSKKQLMDWDKEYIWHPFTQMKDYMDMNPLVIQKGEGCYLVDTSGNRYIDGVSSLWVLVHGHGKKELVDAIQKQSKTLCHSTLLGLANVPSVILAKKLIEIVPKGLSKVFYSDNGSTSVEIALKMAYQYWQQKGEKRRKRFIAFTNAYHGDTIGAVSVGGIDLFHQVYGPLLFKTFKAPSPYCYRCPMKLRQETCGMACVDAFEKVVKKHHEETCAVIIEPLVQGAAGMILQPPGWLNAIWKIAKEYGLLFIADEVATGFGRTGNLFACEEERISPDFMCVAKGITGGYLPLAATLSTEEVFNGFLGQFDEFKTFFHGHTYTGNPIACAVAVESINLFKKEGLLQKLQQKTAILKNSLDRFKELTHVGEVRQKGFMVGIELVKSRKTKRSYAPGDKIGQKVIWEARKRSVIIRPLGDIIVLMPPLAIDRPTLEELVDVTYESIKAVTGS